MTFVLVVGARAFSELLKGAGKILVVSAPERSFTLPSFNIGNLILVSFWILRVLFVELGYLVLVLNYWALAHHLLVLLEGERAVHVETAPLLKHLLRLLRIYTHSHSHSLTHWNSSVSSLFPMESVQSTAATHHLRHRVGLAADHVMSRGARED